MTRLTKSKTNWLLMAALVLSVKTQAQQVHQLTLQQSVDMALKNVVELKNLNLDYKSAVYKNREVTAGALPQVNGTVTGQHFFAIPVQVIPDFIGPSTYGVLAKEGVKDGNGQTIQAVNPNDLPPLQAQFGVPWSVSAGFTVQQLLFQPDVFVALQARGAALDYAKLNIAVANDKVKQNVQNSYYLILVSNQQLQILNDGVKRLEKLYSDAEQIYKNGFTEKLDLDRTKVALNNLKTTRQQLINTVQLANSLLKFNIGVNQKDSIVLTETLTDETIKLNLMDEMSFNYENRNEIKLLNTVEKLQRLDLKRNQLQYIPTIAAYWNYSRNAQRREFDLFKSGSAYPWFPSSIAGVNITVPIWSSGARKNKILQSKITVEKAVNTIEQVKQGIDLEVEQAKINYRNSILNMDAQKDNMELAKSVYNTTKKKYEQGLASNQDVLLAENELQSAQANYFQSLYNAAIAQVAYKRAVGAL
jgi:outer membrane protein